MDIMFNMYKVKYQFLTEQFEEIKKFNSVNSMNIFIDLDDLFHILHKPILNAEFQSLGMNMNIKFMSNIFNLLAHYKWWGNKEGIENVKVYGIYTSGARVFKNNLFTGDYRKKFKEYFDKENSKYFFINSCIQDCASNMNLIAQYIPNVYLIDSKNLEPSAVPNYIARKQNPSDWNIMISSDPYNLQYAYKDKFSLFIPRGSRSEYINMSNFWDYVIRKESVVFNKETNTPEQDELLADIHKTYHMSLYIYCKALVGDKYRNIPKLRKISWKSLIKELDQFDTSKDISDVTMNQNFVNVIVKNKVDQEDFNANMACIDVDQQLETFMAIDRTSIDNQIVDMEDFENLRKINDSKFTMYPINLDFLTKKYVKFNKVKTPFN